MRLLLDTHVLIWAAADPDRLPAVVADELRSPANDVLVSAVTSWEVAIKRGLGRLEFRATVAEVITNLRFTPLAVSHAHAAAVEGLPEHHADPFDRLLVAQALVEDATLVTADEVVSGYDVTTLWG